MTFWLHTFLCKSWLWSGCANKACPTRMRFLSVLVRSVTMRPHRNMHGLIMMDHNAMHEKCICVGQRLSLIFDCFWQTFQWDFLIHVGSVPFTGVLWNPREDCSLLFSHPYNLLMITGTRWQLWGMQEFRRAKNDLCLNLLNGLICEARTYYKQSLCMSWHIQSYL